MSQLKKLETQFNVTSLRERMLILITALVLIGYGWWALAGEQHSQEIDSLVDANSQSSSEVDALRLGLDTLRTELKKGVVNKKRIKLTQLRRQLSTLDKQLKMKTVELIDPDDMFKVLSGLVYKKSNLKLLSLKRLSVKPAIQPLKKDNKSDAAVEQDEGAKIYRHVMQLSLSGSYQDVSNYMQQLESMDWQLIWDSLKIEVIAYPKLTVTIELSTLSDEAKWVGI